MVQCLVGARGEEGVVWHSCIVSRHKKSPAKGVEWGLRVPDRCKSFQKLLGGVWEWRVYFTHPANCDTYRYARSGHPERMESVIEQVQGLSKCSEVPPIPGSLTLLFKI